MSLADSGQVASACESQRIAYQRPTPRRSWAKKRTHETRPDAHSFVEDAAVHIANNYMDSNSRPRCDEDNSALECEDEEGKDAERMAGTAQNAVRDKQYVDHAEKEEQCVECETAAMRVCATRDGDADTQSQVTALLGATHNNHNNITNSTPLPPPRVHTHESHGDRARHPLSPARCAPASEKTTLDSAHAEHDEDGEEEQDSNYGGVFVPAAHQEWLFQLSNSLKEQKPALVEAIRRLGSEVNLGAAYCPRATHLVFLPGVTERTEKYLSFCAAGKPIVAPQYIVESTRRGYWLRGDVARYDLNPRRRLLHYAQPGYRRFTHEPFRAWSVVLLVSHRAIGAGIRAVLAAGGCTRVCCLIGVAADAKGDEDDKDNKKESTPTTTTTTNAMPATMTDGGVICRESCVADGAAIFRSCTHILVECTTMQRSVSSTSASVCNRRRRRINKKSTAAAAVAAAASVCDAAGTVRPGSSESSEEEEREPESEEDGDRGSFAPPAWLPAELYTSPVYRKRVYTLELLPYCLCSSPHDVFDDETGELIHPRRLVSTCRIARAEEEEEEDEIEVNEEKVRRGRRQARN